MVYDNDKRGDTKGLTSVVTLQVNGKPRLFASAIAVANIASSFSFWDPMVSIVGGG